MSHGIFQFWFAFEHHFMSCHDWPFFSLPWKDVCSALLPVLENWVVLLLSFALWLGFFFLVLVFSPPSLQVEEVKRRQHSLAFSSAGAQAQTYHVSFETLAECQRWQRQASKVINYRTSWCGDKTVKAHYRCILKLNSLPTKWIIIFMYLTLGPSKYIMNEIMEFHQVLNLLFIFV